MTRQDEIKEALRSWPTPLKGIEELGNLRLYSRGMESIEVAFDDLLQPATHVFLFSKMLGNHFENAFNCQRIGHSFIVENSSWIRKMEHEPMLTINLSMAIHFKFSCYTGELDVVALEFPRYAKCVKDDYRPLSITRESFDDIPSAIKPE